MDETKPAQVTSNGVSPKTNIMAKPVASDSSSESDSSDEETPVAKATPVKMLNKPQVTPAKAIVQKKSDSSSSDSESDSSEEVCFLTFHC